MKHAPGEVGTKKNFFELLDILAFMVYNSIINLKGVTTMGHNIEFRDYSIKTSKDKIFSEIDSYVRGCTWLEGGSGIGKIRWLETTVCTNYEEAESYLESHDKGWYDCLAVQYKDIPYMELEPSKKMLDLAQRINAERTKCTDYEKAHSVKAFKADFVGCGSCGSKLKRELLQTERCPLCRADLRGKTTLETLAKYRAKIEELATTQEAERKKQQADYEKKQEKNAEIRWLVKFEYHT